MKTMLGVLAKFLAFCLAGEAGGCREGRESFFEDFRVSMAMLLPCQVGRNLALKKGPDCFINSKDMKYTLMDKNGPELREWCERLKGSGELNSFTGCIL